MNRQKKEKPFIQNQKLVIVNMIIVKQGQNSGSQYRFTNVAEKQNSGTV